MKFCHFFWGLCNYHKTNIEEDIIDLELPKDGEDYANKYMKEYNEIKDLSLDKQDDHGSTYFISHKNTIMKYCIDTHSFIYYTTKHRSYEYLQALAREYVVKFNCPRFYSLIGLFNQDNIEEDNEVQEINGEQNEDESDDNDVFVKAPIKKSIKTVSLKNIPHQLTFICKGNPSEFNIRNTDNHNDSNTLSYESFMKLNQNNQK